MSSLSTAPPAGTLGPQNPFPGLRPYQEGDAPWFFGRGREINELLKRLRRVRFLAVVGPSGCGKSSLIKAGVLSGLRDGYLDAEWQIASFCPGEKPLDNLAGELGDRAAVRAVLERGPMGLVEAIQAQKLGLRTNVLILVDQFEELFQFVERRGEAAREEAKQFLKLLLAAAASDDAPVYIVMTMRLEWLNECASYTGLAEAINEGIYLVPQMSRRQFQQAILGPIEAAGGTINSALLDRMLNDLDGRIDQLPVLQHALLRIWQRRKPGEPLGLPVYQEVGTFSDCLSRHANEVFDALSPLEKTAAEGLFRSITQVFKGRKVRRPRPLGEVAAERRAPMTVLENVIEAFRASGRSFLVARDEQLNPSSIIDISHEALIRQWGLLTKWVDDEAVTLARIGRLEETAAEWNSDRQKYQSALFRGLVLQENEALIPRLKPDSTAVAFLKESRREENALARRRKIKRGAAWAAVALLPLIGALWLVNLLRNQNLNITAVAEVQKRRSEEETAALVRQIQSTPNSVQSPQAIQAVVDRVRAKRVFLQYYGMGQQGVAKAVADNFNSQGYSVPGWEDVSAKSKPVTQTIVRYFHDADKDAAARCVGLLPITVSGRAVTQNFPDNRSIVPVGQLEIWLGPNAAQAASGIDINEAIPAIDWRKVKDDGISYAYLQATVGSDYTTRNFRERWSSAKNAGLLRGAYHVMDKSPVAAQVSNFVRAMGLLETFDLPPMLIFYGPASDDVAAWLDGVREQTGARPVVYGGVDFKPAQALNLAPYPLRIGQYGPQPAAPAAWPWTFWQFTDGDTGPYPHSVNGIGKCYRSVFNGSVQDLRTFAAKKS
jgi:GH25 family lysozyme M1 (1,4-beta-N-acetylmuramidase)